VIKQQLPVYSSYIGRGIKPARITTDQINVPVNIGGALVRPGDFIVADGDGVVVVPIEKVDEVAKIAWEIANHDKEKRREQYEAAGRELDWTV
jgi:regulator of RNase E activity RraA